MSTDQMIQEEKERHAQSEAGKALAAHGFEAVHQGGGLVNFEGVRKDGRKVIIIEDVEGSGYGPLLLEQPCIECLLDADEDVSDPEGYTGFSSLRAYLETLA